MLVRIQFVSICSSCGEAIETGDMVSVTRGSKSYLHEECSDEGRAIATLVEESQSVDTDLQVPAPDGLAYLPYQRAGIAYAHRKQNTLLGDEMGLGKTVQALGLVNVCPQIERVCVVCPASLEINWKLEASRWLTRPQVVFRVVPYSRLGPVADSLLSYDLLILDEAHYVKNPDSQRSRHVFKLAKRCGRILALTGTPLPNRPLDLWPLLLLLDPRTWEAFGQKRYTRRYCGAFLRRIGGTDAHPKLAYDVRGASNLDELNKRLRTSCLVRRLKKDVLTELPPKRRQVIVLPNPNVLSELTYPGLPKDYDEAIAELNAGARVPFERIAKARHDEGLRKVKYAVEHVERALESGLNKIIVFAHHADVLNALETALAPHGVVRVDGSKSPEERQQAVDLFQLEEHGSVSIFLGALKAAGVGLTLTAASHVLFVEADWTPSTLAQAEDRAHRIGQRISILITYLVLDGTIDARMLKMIAKKLEVIDRVLAPAVG